jgi:hypothetical protein
MGNVVSTVASRVLGFMEEHLLSEVIARDLCSSLCHGIIYRREGPVGLSRIGVNEAAGGLTEASGASSADLPRWRGSDSYDAG